jgi:transposase-like protein
MIYAATREEVERQRKAFIRKWRLRHRAVADSLQEAGDRLFTFMRLPLGQWHSARTTNAIERLHEEFKRRIKTQTVLRTPRPWETSPSRPDGRAIISAELALISLVQSSQTSSYPRPA